MKTFRIITRPKMVLMVRDDHGHKELNFHQFSSITAIDGHSDMDYDAQIAFAVMADMLGNHQKAKTCYRGFRKYFLDAISSEGGDLNEEDITYWLMKQHPELLGHKGDEQHFDGEAKKRQNNPEHSSVI